VFADQSGDAGTLAAEHERDATPRAGMLVDGARRCLVQPHDGESEVLQPFMDMLALEVARALQFFFTSTQYNEVSYIVLAGGCAALPGLDEAVATRTQVSTLVANPFELMTLSSRIKPRQLQMDAPALMIACGLAMRRFDPS